MFKMRVSASAWLVSAAVLLPGLAAAQTAVRVNLDQLTLDSAATAATAAAGKAAAAQPKTGTVRVAVRLTDPPLALAVGANAKIVGSTMSLAQRQAYMAMLKQKQDALMAQIRLLGGVEVGRVTKSYNALMVAADVARLPQIARLTGVSAIRPLVDFQVSLTSTVPYVGGSALQGLGLTGAGVKIAVLDSGIDYTHRNLGGSGLLADFATAAANATTLPGGLFPSAKVIGGYDFVGETWTGTAPFTVLQPDPNPIDAGTGAGHGTHVADIAAGASLDGLHKGMAPGAKLYAVKVCSSVSNSCSGEAILHGLDWVIDPNNDLDFSDAADVVNLSLGSSYGQRENSSTEAVSNVVRFGIVAAISAGNAGDRPYILGSPSSAAEAISVAQTAMPNSVGIPLVINAPAAIAGLNPNTATVDWAPIVNGFTGIVKRAGATNTAAARACALADTVDFTGRVALIDRGACAVSIKVENARAKGAIGVIISLVAGGDAITFSNGSAPGALFVETLVVSQAIGNKLKSVPAETANITVSPNVTVPLVGSMASSSSRGPTYNFSAIKPEIGAPGGSVSAITGTGTGEGGFGGTSGAAPMVAGAAALLLQKFPGAVPAQIKSRLMNSANTQVYTNPATLPGVLAPISRIGGGELRVDRAAALTTGIWDATNPYNVGLAFGAPHLAANTTLSKKVAVRNYTGAARTYSITRSFRYADDQASGAVTLSAPASITVPGNGTAAFLLTLTVNAANLPAWALSGGGVQGNGALLNAMEFDGYITVADTADSASVPWHILPHKSANVLAATSVNLGGASNGGLPISNLSAATNGTTDVFALTGTSPLISANQPVYGSNQAIIDLKAVGVRALDSGRVIQFGISTYGDRAHPAYPAEFQVYVDVNNDGVDDFVIFNAENTGFGLSGQTVVVLLNLNTGTRVVRFFADADLNSSNMIYSVLAADLGLTNLNQAIRFSVLAFDNYHSGNLTDAVFDMTHTLGTPAYAMAEQFVIPVGAAGALPFSKVAGGAAASPSQTGFLLLHRDAKTGREADLVTITP